MIIDTAPTQIGNDHCTNDANGNPMRVEIDCLLSKVV